LSSTQAKVAVVSPAAMPGSSACFSASVLAPTATAESGEIVLNGHKSYVIDGHTADLSGHREKLSCSDMAI
jgi:hypothetical protein